MQRKLEYERQLESRDEIALITPGLFREFRRANLVVFVESINTLDGTIRNVFLHSVEDGKDATTVARSGSLQVAANGDRFIVLDDGRRYEGKPGTHRIPHRRVRPARAPDRACGAARAAGVDQGDPDRHAASPSTGRSSAPSCSGGSRFPSRRSC